MTPNFQNCLPYLVEKTAQRELTKMVGLRTTKCKSSQTQSMKLL